MDKTFKEIKLGKKINEVKKNEKKLINFYKKNLVKYNKEFHKVYNNYLESLQNIDNDIEHFNSLESSIKQNIPLSLKPTNVKNKDISINNHLLIFFYSRDCMEYLEILY